MPDKPIPHEPPNPLFTDEETRIFEYTDGQRKLKGDPIRITRRLLAAARKAGFELQATLNTALWQAPPEDEVEIPEGKTFSQLMAPLENFRDNAIESLVPVLHEGFGTHAVNPENGLGATDAEAFDNIGKLMDWMSQKKASGEKSAETPPSTDSASPTSLPLPEPRAAKPMRSGVASTSTAAGQ